MMNNKFQFESNQSTNKEWMRYTIILGSIAASICIFALLVSNLFIVQQNEYVIVRQFGEIKKVIDKPGLHMKVPFIQSMTRLPNQHLLYEINSNEVNTLDKKRILVDHYMIWKIADPELMIQNARGSLEVVEDRIGDTLYSLVRTELGRLKFDQIINSEGTARENFNEHIVLSINQLVENFGVSVIDIQMKRTDLSPSNEQSVFQRMISERESMAQKYLSEGDAEATRIRAEADRNVQEMISTAKADGQLIIAEGENEAARIYNEAYSVDPEFYHFYHTLLSYKTSLEEEPVIMIPIDSPYAKYLLGVD